MNADIDALIGLETKIARSSPRPRAAAAFEELMRAFEAFKETNDERLDESSAHVRRRPVRGEGRSASTAPSTSTRRRLDELALNGAPALEACARRGALPRPRAQGAPSRPMCARARRGLIAPRGEGAVGRAPARTAAISCRRRPRPRSAGSCAMPRRSARWPRVRTISAAVYKKPFAITGPATGWVGETAAAAGDRRARRSPSCSFPAMEIYAMPAATQTLLDDAAVDIDQWIAEEVQAAFAEKEGDGLRHRRRRNEAEAASSTIRKVAEAAWSWGKIGYIATGVAGAFAAAAPPMSSSTSSMR